MGEEVCNSEEWFCTITGVLGFIVQFRPKILGLNPNS
jgi:hypothetical protein